MPYASNKDLPDSIAGSVKSENGRDIMRNVINSQLEAGKSETVAFASAWAALQRAGYEQNNEGEWVDKTLSLGDVHVPSTEERGIIAKALNWLKGEKSVNVSAINKAIEEQAMIDDYVSKADNIEKAEYQGKEVELNKPFRTPGESKKFAVYVRNDKGNVVMVRFGDPEMAIQRDDPEARANFRARHSCDTAKDKTTARYWSCVMWSGKPVSDILEKAEDFNLTADILKSDNDQRLVYGWASIIYENGEPVTDSQGDIIAEDDLLEAAHNYISQYREAKAMHEGDQIGEVVESLVFTADVQKALGIDLGKVGWFIGMKINDDVIWESVKSGSLAMFSIGGRGIRVEIND